MANGFGSPPVTSPSPMVRKLNQKVQQQVRALEDPRVKQKPKHFLIDIVAITTLAMLSGANHRVAIEIYGQAKQSWLKTSWNSPMAFPPTTPFQEYWGC